jgi:hypothetical protein
MRFGQLPSVREMTPDITSLLKARQIKDQAFQNITGTISQLAAQKQKKELDKEKTQQAIAAVSPFIEALKANNPELKKTNFNAADLVKSVGADKAISQVQDLMKSMNEESFRENQIKLQRRANKIAAREFMASENQKILEAQKEEKDAQITDQRDLLNSAIRSKLSDVPLDKINATYVQELARKEVEQNPDSYSALSNAEVARVAGSSQEGKVDTATKIGEAREAAAKGEKEELDLVSLYENNETNFRKGLQSTKSSLQKRALILADVNELLPIFVELSGESSLTDEALTRIVQQRIPGSDADYVKDILASLASKIGMDQLLSMRTQSKDGSSGFGQLTQMELEALQSSQGTLLRDGKIANFRVVLRSLKNIKTTMEGRQQEILEDARFTYKKIADKYEISNDQFNSYFVIPNYNDDGSGQAGGSTEVIPSSALFDANDASEFGGPPEQD